MNFDFIGRLILFARKKNRMKMNVHYIFKETKQKLTIMPKKTRKLYKQLKTRKKPQYYIDEKERLSNI